MVNIVVATIFMLRYFFGLIFFPYKTMRSIVKEKDFLQIIIIFCVVYSYFVIANIIRRHTFHPFIISSSSLVSFAFFIISFILVTVFFYAVGKVTKHPTGYRPLIFSFVYSLFPTLIWFFTTSLLFFLLPPPRTVSFFGQIFSFFFVAFSLTLLSWRIVLLYLSVRFSMKTDFYNTMFYILLFFLWFIPYSYLMYYLRFFRIPLI